jgi:hypothetical protein
MEHEWIVRLPPRAQPPFRVFINGVEQHEGEDYLVREDSLRFSRPLAKEGKLGFWRWTAMFFGIFGTYRKNDSVDIQYMVNGHQRLATGLDIEPAGPARQKHGARDVGRQHRNR